jgi:hypothetical protein
MARNVRSILAGVVLVMGASVPVVLAVEATHDAGCSRDCLVQVAQDYLGTMKNLEAKRILADEVAGEAAVFGVAQGREFAVRLKVEHRKIQNVEMVTDNK